MWIWTESHPAGCGERDADDDAECRHVTMPPELRAWRILRDRALRQRCCGESGPRGRALAKRLQAGGKRRGRRRRVRGEVVPRAEADDAPFRRERPVQRLLQRQFFDLTEKAVLICRREKAGFIHKPPGKS